MDLVRDITESRKRIYALISTYFTRLWDSHPEYLIQNIPCTSIYYVTIRCLSLKCLASGRSRNSASHSHLKVNYCLKAHSVPFKSAS